MGLADRCLMTWEPAKSRWRKMQKGKVYTITCEALGLPATATKEASYWAANAWWEAKRAELEARKPQHPHRYVIDELTQRRDWAVANEPGMVPAIEAEIAIVGDLPEGDRFASAFLGEQISSTVWGDRLSRHDAPSLPTDRTIAAQIDRHLFLERARVDAGQLSVSEFDTIRRASTTSEVGSAGRTRSGSSTPTAGSRGGRTSCARGSASSTRRS